MTTNSPAGLGLVEDDRRYFLLHSDKTRHDYEEGYFMRLHDFLDSKEGAAALYHRYLNLDLGSRIPHDAPPQTAAYKRYARTHEMDWQCLAAEFIEDSLYTHQVFTRTAIREHLDEVYKGNFRVSDHKLKAFLLDAKQGLATRAIRVKSSPRIYYYCKSEHEGILSEVSNLDPLLVKNGGGLSSSL